MFNIDRYTYVVERNQITAMTTYRGELVTSKAKCDPQDKFDFEAGKKLAAYRLNLKVAKIREKVLTMKLEAAVKEVEEISKALSSAKCEIEESDKALESLSGMFED